MGRRRVGRRVDGILVVNKPAGASSNRVLQRVKGLYGAAKAGHTGNLDPLATGVLPICFGEATKLSQYLLDADKEYVTTIQLGVTTATGDADGAVTATANTAAIDVADVDAVIARFVGLIEQVPPMYSALKRDGVPLYQLARKGVEVERAPRAVSIHELERLEFVAGEHARLRIRVRCSKGTYVRVLAEDIGSQLGCGAHVASLHRSHSGPFGDTGSVTMEELQTLRDADDFARMDSLLLPMSSAVAHLPEVRVPEASCFYLAQGQAVLVPGKIGDGPLRLTDEAGELRGIGERLEDGRVAPRRMMNK